MESESARILADYLAGKDDAARIIFDRYADRLIALAKSRLSEKLQGRVDPEDIVQSVYRSFFRKADNQELLLQRSGDLWRLLAAMTVNKVLGRTEYELAQKRDPRSEASGSLLLNVLEKEPTPEEAVIMIEQVTAFMEGLKERDRRILELRLQGASIEDIAAAHKLSEASVRRVLRGAREQLERRLLGE
jgi:RNA polymerase sigma-70 factor (ECF subfamily)